MLCDYHRLVPLVTIELANAESYLNCWASLIERHSIELGCES